MPTILVNVGPGLHETAIVLTYGKRHLLGFLVCLGSPSVLFNNTVGLRELVGNIMSFKDSISTSRLWGPNSYTIIIEYVLALAAVANIGEVFYEIGVKTASTITQKEQSLPAIWIGIGAATHILGAVVLQIAQGKYPPRSFQITDLREGLFQFTPRVEIEPFEFRLQPCSIQEMGVSWLIGIIATLNLIRGTMFFSSILFFPLEAALWTVLRIMLSAILCRIIVRYEICAIREQQPSQADQNSDQVPMNSHVPSDRSS